MRAEGKHNADARKATLLKPSGILLAENREGKEKEESHQYLVEERGPRKNSGE